MSFWSFLWTAIWRETDMLTRILQTAVVTLPALMALIVAVFGGEWTKDLWPAWIWILISVIALIIAFASRVTIRAFKMEKERAPLLRISDPIIFSDDKYNELYVVATNTSETVMLRDCLFKLLDFRDLDKPKHLGIRTPVAYPTFHQRENKQQHPFNLRAKEPKDIPILRIDKRQPNAIQFYNKLGFVSLASDRSYLLSLQGFTEGPPTPALEIVISSDGQGNIICKAKEEWRQADT